MNGFQAGTSAIRGGQDGSDEMVPGIALTGKLRRREERDVDWTPQYLLRPPQGCGQVAEAHAPDNEDINIARGDLFAPGLSGAMRGFDAVFHLAATYSLWRRDRSELLRELRGHTGVKGQVARIVRTRR